MLRPWPAHMEQISRRAKARRSTSVTTGEVIRSKIPIALIAALQPHDSRQLHRCAAIIEAPGPHLARRTIAGWWYALERSAQPGPVIIVTGSVAGASALGAEKSKTTDYFIIVYNHDDSITKLKNMLGKRKPGRLEWKLPAAFAQWPCFAVRLLYSNLREAGNCLQRQSTGNIWPPRP